MKIGYINPPQSNQFQTDFIISSNCFQLIYYHYDHHKNRKTRKKEVIQKRSLNDILYEALSNLFLLMFLKDNERNRTRMYYVGLVSIYFCQISGFLCSQSSKPPNDQYQDYFFTFLQSTRVTYILKSMSSDLVFIGILGTLCSYEVLILYFCSKLSFANIKDDVDVLKKEGTKIGFVQLYFEHQKWVYCLIKLDLIFDVFFCTSYNGIVSSPRCSLNLSFSTGGITYIFLLTFAIILIFTTIIINIIIVMIYHNPEMSAVNQLKSRYSQFKQFEPILEVLLVGSSYMNSPALLFIIGHMFGLFLMIEYFMHFPLMDKNISDIYGWMILVYEMFITLFTFREYTQWIKDVNFPIMFLISICILYGVLKTIWNNKIIFSMTVDPNRLGEFPQSTCLYLEKLCELYEQSFTSFQSKLILFGSLQIHKVGCNVALCPCKDIQYNELAGKEKPTVSGGMIIDLGQDIKIKGVDFARICGNQDVFDRWFFSFIDYQFEVLIAHLIKKNMETIVQEVCLRYWFFLIKIKKNQIKALYQDKIMNSLLKKKDTFFSTVERSLTNLIESKIREKDKAHSYSYSQKDRSDAQNNLKFDRMVFSETEKDRLKKILGMLVFDKCDYMEQMIRGFKTIEDMRIKTLQLINFIEYFEGVLLKQISQNQNNIYFLKFSSLMKAYILFDPVNCRETEQDVEEIINREKSIDQSTTITSISILQGNVGSIIASFKNTKENGKILKFSEKIPQIFKYSNKGEFQTKTSVTELIPDCIGRLHDQFLMRLIQTGVAKTVRNYRTMFAKDRDGYIFMVKLFINYYFVKQDDFAFSALIIKCPNSNMHIMLDGQGYIEGLSSNFVELINGFEIDMQYYKKCNIGIFIPQFIEFIYNFDPKEEYSFLKFKIDIPKEMSKFASQFIQHHSNYHQKMDVSQKEWKKNLEQFTHLRSVVKEISYEITANIKHELFSDNGKDVMIFIIEIVHYQIWEEAQTSLFTASTAKSKLSNNLILNSSANEKIGDFNCQSNRNEMMDSEQILVGENRHVNQQESKKDQKTGTSMKVDNQQDHAYEETFSKSVTSYLPLSKTNPSPKMKKSQKIVHNLDDSNMQFINNNYNTEHFDTQNIQNTLMTQQIDVNHQNDETIQFNQIEQQHKNDSELLHSDQNIDFRNNTNSLSQPDQIKQSTNFTDDKPKNQIQNTVFNNSNINKDNNDDESSHNNSKQSKKESIDNTDQEDDLKQTGLKMNKKQDNIPVDQGSKSNSIQSSSTSVLKNIISNTTEKSTPPFIAILNAVFLFQFIVFICVVIVLSVTISQSFNSYTGALNEMGRSAKLLIPVNQALISSDLLSLANAKDINNLQNEYSPFMMEHLQVAYSDFSQNLFNFMEKQVQYAYQRELFQYQIEADIMANNVEEQIPIYFTEYLKKAGESLYDLNRFDNLANIAILQTSRVILKNNLNATYTLLHQVSLQINSDLITLQNSIITVNTYSIVLAILLILISFIFIIPSYKSLKFKSERILMIVSRMKEQETNELIDNLRQIGQRLFSDDDEYLHIDFSNLVLREEQELISSHRNIQQSGRQSKKQRQNYLYDRIQDNQLRFYTFIVMLLALCLLSLLFFLIIFLFLNQFASVFGQPAEKYKLFIEGALCYSTVSNSNNMLLMNQFLDNYNIKFITDAKQVEIKSLRDMCYTNSRQYFSNSYNDIQNFGDGMAFRDRISSINQNQACQLNILNQYYYNYCTTAQEGVLNRGLKQAITSSLDKINDQISLRTGFDYLFNSLEFQEGIVVQLLIIDFMRNILDLFEDENRRIKDSFLNSLMLIITLGSLVYVLIFFVVIGFYVRKLKSDYLIIKRAIQLIPYKRLTEDTMTLFLLKKIMDI